MIVSGSSVGILDPHMKYASDIDSQGVKTGGKKYTLASLVKPEVQNQLAPIDGLFSFCKTELYYKSTLFRFPLRTNPSEISDKCYTAEDVLKELKLSLAKDASHIFLFLRNVIRIELFTIRPNQNEMTLESQAFINEASLSVIREAQRKLQLPTSRITSVMYPCSITEINCSVADASCQHFWLVSQTIGTNNDALRIRAESLKVSPTVGVAAPLPLEFHSNGLVENLINDPISLKEAIAISFKPNFSSKTVSLPVIKGLAFCFLPLPLCTGLPVHINGYFIPTDDRQHIKWPILENTSAEASWNKELVEDLLIPTYASILVAWTALLGTFSKPNDLHNVIAYALWPVVTEMKNRPIWSTILIYLLTYICQKYFPLFWTPLGTDNWVSVNSCYVFVFTKEEQKIGLQLASLQEKVVFLPENISASLGDLPIKASLPTLNPHRVRVSISKNRDLAIKKFNENRDSFINLLEYVFSDVKDYDCLLNLPVVPLMLKSNSPAILSTRENKPHPIYVITDDLTARILKPLERCLLYENLPQQLLEHFTKMAKSGIYQLAIATVEVVSSQLLERAILSLFRTTKGSVVHWTPDRNGHPNRHYLIDVWKWLLQFRVPLNIVSGLPLVPNMSLDRYDYPQEAKLLPLQENGHTVRHMNYWGHDTNLDNLYHVIAKLGCNVVENMIQVMHFEGLPSFDSFLPLISQERLIQILQRLSAERRIHQLEAQEKRILYSYLREYVKGDKLLDPLLKYLRSLPIYETINGNFISLQPLNEIIFPRLDVSVSLSQHTQIPLNILKVDHYNMSSYEVLVGRPPEDLGSLILNHLIPLALKCSAHTGQISIILLILKIVDSSDKILIERLSKIKFISSKSKTLFSPGELYFPSQELISFFEEHEDVFPHQALQPVLDKLQLLGLKTLDSLRKDKDKLIKFLIERIRHVKGMRNIMKAKQRSQAAIKASFEASCLPEFFQKAKLIPFLFCEADVPAEFTDLGLQWAGTKYCNQPLTPDQVSYYYLTSPQQTLAQTIVGSVLPIIRPQYNQQDILIAKEIPVKSVVQHLEHLSKLDRKCFDLDKRIGLVYNMVLAVYFYLDSLKASAVLKTVNFPFIFEPQHRMFFERAKAAIQSLDHYLPGFVSVHASYPHLSRDFWKSCGVKEQFKFTDLLQAIHNLKSFQPLNEDRIKLVTQILQRICVCAGEESLKSEQLKGILLPNCSGLLLTANECVFDDRQWNERLHDLYEEIKVKYNLIHPLVPARVAEVLQIPPLSSRIAKPRSLKIKYQLKGHHETVTRRIKGIIDDYKDHIDVLKELIQNADDAGATEVKFLIDWRSHSTSNGALFTEGMKHWQGPALFAYNNSMFSDEDFENICKIAGETKKEDVTKIGRFGLGFCATYQITDLPSLISRDRVIFLDPHVKYLGDSGVEFNFVQERKELLLSYYEQMMPYENIFGFTLYNETDEYPGALFRFPFRNSEMANQSDIAPGFVVNQSYINQLVKSLTSTAEKLIVFLRNVCSIELYQLQDGMQPQQMARLYSVKRNGKRSKDLLQSFQRKGTDTSDILCFDVSVEDCTQAYLLPNRSLWISSSTLGLTGSKKMALTQDGCKRGLVPFAEVAVTMHTATAVCPVPLSCSNIFCFLPLNISASPLCFHVNGFFDISKDRRSLRDLQDRNSWNSVLIADAVVEAICNLLVYLCQRAPNPDQEILPYFYQLWPSKSDSDLAKIVFSAFYKHFCERKLKIIWCRKTSKWESLKDVWFLSQDFYDGNVTEINRNTILCVLEYCGKSMATLPEAMATLPEGIITHLRNFVRLNEISFKEYVTQFLIPNLEKLPLKMVVEQVKFVLNCFRLKIYDFRRMSKHLQSAFFVPCKPEGKVFRKPCELVSEKKSYIKCLFEESEGRFPLADLSDFFNDLKDLGTREDILRDNDVLDRAKKIEELSKSTSSPMAMPKAECFIRYLEHHYQQIEREKANQLSESLSRVAFLPIYQKPNDLLLPWCHVTQTLAAACNLFPFNALGLVFTNSPVVNMDKLPKSLQENLKRFFKAPISPELVFDNLVTIIDRSQQSTLTKADFLFLNKHLPSVYNHLQKICISTDTLRNLKTRLANRPFIWIGDYCGFYGSHQVTLEEEVPINYPGLLVTVKGTPYYELFENLGVKKNLDLQSSLAILETLKNIYRENPLKDEHFHCVTFLSLKLDSLFTETRSGLRVYLPDQDKILRLSQELIYCAEKLRHLLPPEAKQQRHFLHHQISESVATKLGVIDILAEFSNKMADDTLFGGEDFGQHEDLCARLNGLLTQYEPNMSMFTEFIQNAEDACASEVAFVIDRRHQFEKNVLFSTYKNFKSLHDMPSLLVFNNRKFTVKDIVGITKLGVGGKRGDADAIGRFGIGFNVAYHITDSPTLLSCDVGGDPQYFCLFDPHKAFFSYLENSRPGKLWQNTEERKLSNFIDQLKPFLGDMFPKMARCVPGVIQDLASGWQNGYSVFRLPLTRNRSGNHCWKTKLDKGYSMTLGKLQRFLAQFQQQIPEMLLFLNNVKQISVFDISESGDVNNFCCFTANSKQIGDIPHSSFAVNLRESCSRLSQGQVPQSFSTCNALTVTQHEGRADLIVKKGETNWLVSKCFRGTLPEDLVLKGYKESLLPVASVASVRDRNMAACDGKIFVSLPLDDNPSYLPIHIHGAFWIDPSRKHIQHTREGALKDWNKSLVDCVVSKAYSFLLQIGTQLIDKSNKQQISWFYNLFPDLSKATAEAISEKARPLEAFGLPQKVYINLLEDRAAILIDIVNQSVPSSWLCVESDGRTKKGWFLKDSQANNLVPVFLELGLGITSAPYKICSAFRKVNPKYQGEISPHLLITLLKQVVQFKQKRVEDVIKHNIETIWHYILQIKPISSQLLSGLPLILLCTNELRVLPELCYSHADRENLPHRPEDFVSERLWRDKFIRDFLCAQRIVIPLSPSHYAQHIQLPKGDSPIPYKGEYRKTLVQFWKWAFNDSTVQLLPLFSKVMLIPTDKRTLFPLSMNHSVLVTMPYIQKESSKLPNCLLKKFGIPCINWNIFKDQIPSASLQTIKNMFDLLPGSSPNDPERVMNLIKASANRLPKSITLLQHEMHEVAILIERISQSTAYKRKEPLTIELLKQLPIYSFLGDPDATGRPINPRDRVFLFPNSACRVGLTELQQHKALPYQVAFLQYFNIAFNNFEFLRSLGIHIFNDVEFYLTVVIPYLHLLDVPSIQAQVKFVLNELCMPKKGTLFGFNAQESQQMKKALKEKEFITASDKSQKNPSFFYSPTSEFVKMFIPKNKQLPGNWCQGVMIGLLVSLGVHTLPDTNLWLTTAKSFCENPSNFKDGDLILLNTLAALANSLKIERKSDELTDFLFKASKIPFIRAQASALLSQIVEGLGNNVCSTFPKYIALKEATLSSYCCLNAKYSTSVGLPTSTDIPSLSELAMKGNLITAAFKKNMFSEEGFFGFVTEALGIQEVTPKLVAENLLLLCRIVSQCPSPKKIMLVMKQLKVLFIQHYQFLSANISNLQNDHGTIQRLSKSACWLIESVGPSAPFLVPSSSVVEHISSSQELFAPFLVPVPDYMESFIQLLRISGVKKRADPSHYVGILQSLHEKISALGSKFYYKETKEERQAMLAYKELIILIRSDESGSAAQFISSCAESIPLPVEEGAFLLFTPKLVFNDAEWMKRRLPAGHFNFVQRPPADDQGSFTLPECFKMKQLSTLVGEYPDDSQIRDADNRCTYQISVSDEISKCPSLSALLQLLHSKEFTIAMYRIAHNNHGQTPTEKEGQLIRRIQEMTIYCVQDVRTYLHNKLSGSRIDNTEKSVNCILLDQSNEMFITLHSSDGSSLLRKFVDEISNILGTTFPKDLLSHTLSCSHPLLIEKCLDDLHVLRFGGYVPSLLGTTMPVLNDFELLIPSTIESATLVKYFTTEGRFSCAKVQDVLPDSNGGIPSVVLEVAPGIKKTVSSLLVCNDLSDNQCSEMKDSLKANDLKGSLLQLHNVSLKDASTFSNWIGSGLESIKECDSLQIQFVLERLVFHFHFLCWFEETSCAMFTRCLESFAKILQQHSSYKEISKKLLSNGKMMEEFCNSLQEMTAYSCVGNLYMRHCSFCKPEEEQRLVTTAKKIGNMWMHFHAPYALEDLLHDQPAEEGATAKPNINVHLAGKWIIQAKMDLQLAQHLKGVPFVESSAFPLLSEGHTAADLCKYPHAICFYCCEAIEKGLIAISLAYCNMNRQQSLHVLNFYQKLKDHPECPDEMKNLDEFVVAISSHGKCCRFPDENLPFNPPFLTHDSMTASEMLRLSEEFMKKLKQLKKLSPFLSENDFSNTLHHYRESDSGNCDSKGKYM